jgi:hypothetical protein
MTLRIDLHGLTGLELREANGGFSGEPLILLVAEQGLAEGFADHLAGIVVETAGDLAPDGVFKFWGQGDVHDGRLQGLPIFVNLGGWVGTSESGEAQEASAQSRAFGERERLEIS